MVVADCAERLRLPVSDRVLPAQRVVGLLHAELLEELVADKRDLANAATVDRAKDAIRRPVQSVAQDWHLKFHHSKSSHGCQVASLSPVRLLARTHDLLNERAQRARLAQLQGRPDSLPGQPLKPYLLLEGRQPT